jgi:aminodeoxyfutalosine deaminase
MPLPPVPKIELHVHLEGAVRAKDLFEMATRNRFPLPVADESELALLYRFRDFGHFLELWRMTTPAIQTDRDFRQVVVSYAEEAASHGAVYVEGIFTPAERVRGGASWDEVFSGFCDGIAEAKERFGVEVRLTPDTPRDADLDLAMETARYAARYRERGVVALGLGGPEASHPPEPFERAFRTAKEAGLGSVPHARPPDPLRSVARSTSSRPTGSATGSARSRIPVFWLSWPTGPSCATSVRCPTCAPGWSIPSNATR